MKSNRIRNAFAFTGVLFGFATAYLTPMSYADDAETQLKNKTEDVKAGTKKAARDSQSDVRKSLGTDTASQDVKDQANDIKDDATKTKNKAENEVNQ